MEGSVLRLFRFRPQGPGSVLDATLRDQVVPHLAALPGLGHVYLGRHGPDESGERLIVSVWESAAAMSAGLGANGGSTVLDDHFAATAQDPAVEVLPIAVELDREGAGVPGVLRVFRGETRAGLLDEYIADVRSGTIADVEAGRGPLALFLGVDAPTRFVTVSVWTGWDVIEAATGGNLRRPVSTQHADRLVAGSASHYEVVPEAAPRSTGTVAAS